MSHKELAKSIREYLSGQVSPSPIDNIIRAVEGEARDVLVVLSRGEMMSKPVVRRHPGNRWELITGATQEPVSGPPCPDCGAECIRATRSQDGQHSDAEWACGHKQTISPGKVVVRDCPKHGKRQRKPAARPAATETRRQNADAYRPAPWAGVND